MKTIRSSKVAKAIAILALGANLSMIALPALAASVRLGGQQVIAITSAAGGLSAAQRADKIQQNLDNALVAANDRSVSSVKVVYVKGQPVVTLGGYYVVTVDGAAAKAAGTTPAILAERWSKALKTAMANKASVNAYVASLTGTSTSSGSSASGNGKSTSSGTASKSSGSGSYTASKPPAYDTTPASSNSAAGSSNPDPDYGSRSTGTVHRGRVAYIPAGMTLSAKLSSGLVSGLAKPGDVVEARITEPVNLGDAAIPAGTVIAGTVVQTKAAERMAKSGSISIKFNSLRTPDGTVTPISAHIVGGIDKYTEKGADPDTIKGETFKDKLKRTAIAGAVGAGSGAVLGTTIGAIAGNGRGAGRGAWAGATIGAGLGVAESLLLRKGGEVTLKQGANVTLQLDSSASVAASSATY